jgi:dynein heavy chain
MSRKKIICQYKQQGYDVIIGNIISEGSILIMEDLPIDLDPMLTPILGKETYKTDNTSKAVSLKVGTEDYEFKAECNIYFLTKIANPHFKPEIIAQCTLINFIVTEKGLEDQLLAMVVNIEKPELEEEIKRYIDEINEYQRELIEKEDDVLKRLDDADPATILENKDLIKSLESTKARAEEINITSVES